MPRRGFDSLSASYRARLLRGGITRQSYESGASLRTARGHARTPEHPGQGFTRPEFQPYYQQRQTVYAYRPTPGQHSPEVKQLLAQRIYGLFGNRHKFRGALDPDFPPPGRPGMPPYPPAPPDEQILEILEYDDFTIEELAAEAYDTTSEFWFLWYH